MYAIFIVVAENKSTYRIVYTYINTENKKKNYNQEREKNRVSVDGRRKKGYFFMCA